MLGALSVSILTEASSFLLLPARSFFVPALPGSESPLPCRQPGPGTGSPVRSRARHDRGGEEEPAVLQAVYREEPESRLHPEQHDGLAVGW